MNNYIKAIILIEELQRKLERSKKDYRKLFSNYMYLKKELKTKEKTIEYLDYDLKRCRKENKKLKKENNKKVFNLEV